MQNRPTPWRILAFVIALTTLVATPVAVWASHRFGDVTDAAFVQMGEQGRQKTFAGGLAHASGVALDA